MKYGISDSDLDEIIKIISKFENIRKVVIFGSRAIGNYKNGSDVDLAIYFDEPNLDVLSKLKYELNETTTMPYFFDIIDYDSINNNKLLEHINNYGKLLIS